MSGLDRIDISAWDRTVTATFEDNRRTLVATAARIVGNDHAADVVHDAFIRVWSNPDKFDPTRSTLARYLNVVARGTAIDRVRAIGAQRKRDGRDADRSVTALMDHADDLIAEEGRRRVRRAVNSLPAGEREAITLAFFGHHTYVEVARLLGEAEGTVKSRIRHGLMRLHRELESLITQLAS